jgi:hypothetical protein
MRSGRLRSNRGQTISQRVQSVLAPRPRRPDPYRGPELAHTSRVGSTIPVIEGFSFDKASLSPSPQLAVPSWFQTTDAAGENGLAGSWHSHLATSQRSARFDSGFSGADTHAARLSTTTDRLTRYSIDPSLALRRGSNAMAALLWRQLAPRVLRHMACSSMTRAIYCDCKWSVRMPSLACTAATSQRNAALDGSGGWGGGSARTLARTLPRRSKSPIQPRYDEVAHCQKGENDQYEC